MNKEAVELVKHFIKEANPVAKAQQAVKTQAVQMKQIANMNDPKKLLKNKMPMPVFRPTILPHRPH